MRASGGLSDWYDGPSPNSHRKTRSEAASNVTEIVTPGQDDEDSVEDTDV